MRFFKEYIILFLIIVFVILIEVITDNITYRSLESINVKIKDLEAAIERDEAKEKVKELSEEWKKEETKLCYYMEHDELEKVSVLVDNVKSNIEADNDDVIKEQVNEIKYILEHVKNKQKIELKNIF